MILQRGVVVDGKRSRVEDVLTLRKVAMLSVVLWRS